MRIPAIAMLLTLVSPILADCPRVPGEEMTGGQMQAA